MKTKIFLGAYVNFPNAQNINCDNIAKHLDKEQFEVHVMYSSRLPVDKKRYQQAGIHLHRLIHRRYIWFWNKLITMLAANCDIYYLPKMESVDRFFARAFRSKSRTFLASVEGVVGGQILADDVKIKGYYDLMDDYFSISHCIKKSVLEFWDKDTETLHLGVDNVRLRANPKTGINSIIWIGSLIERKRPGYLLEIAKHFPQLRFTMIGDGDMMEQIKHRIKEENIGNVMLTGRIPNDQVYAHMMKYDLLLMTSEFEGLPKVIQEAAQCGLPSIYMAENYKVDFLEDGVNGYEALSLDEMCRKVSFLLSHPDEYRTMSQNAAQIIQNYTWENLIPKYEDYFVRMLTKKRDS